MQLSGEALASTPRNVRKQRQEGGRKEGEGVGGVQRKKKIEEKGKRKSKKRRKEGKRERGKKKEGKKTGRKEKQRKKG